LAKASELVEGGRGTVLHRQDDPARVCFLLVSGRLGLHSVDGDSRVDGRPRSALLGAGKGKRHAERFRCLEGFSTYSSESDFGPLLCELTEGAIADDPWSLREDRPHAVTARCIEDCTLLRVPGEQFTSLTHEVHEEFSFFDAHMPCAAEWTRSATFAKLQEHPMLLFRKEVYEAGAHLITEGLNAQPTMFFVRAGSVLMWKSAEPYALRSWLVGFGPLANPTGAHGKAEAHLVCETLGEGSIFSTLSWLPLPGREPFTAVAGPGCVVYVVSGHRAQHLPTEDRNRLRQILGRQLSQRLRRVEAVRRGGEADCAEPPAPGSSAPHADSTLLLGPGAVELPGGAVDPGEAEAAGDLPEGVPGELVRTILPKFLPPMPSPMAASGGSGSRVRFVDEPSVRRFKR